MIKLAKVLLTHLKSELHVFSLLYALLFCSLMIVFKDSIELQKSHFLSHFRSFQVQLFLILYNYILYYFVLIPILAFRKKLYILKKADFWIKSLFFLTLIGVNIRGFLRDYVVAETDNYILQHYLYIIIHNINTLVVILPLLLLFRLLYDKKNISFYGFNRQNAHLKQFSSLLLIIIPLVCWAAFQADFRQTYPTFKPWYFSQYFGENTWLAGIIMELSEPVSFIYTELIFRGMLVVGMVEILGTEALLPMAAFYCIYHFGKPDAEIISSFFGGYILGVFALKFKNIWGGTLIHIALAWLMELSAITYYFFTK